MVIKTQEISRNVFLVIGRWKMDSNSTKQPRNVLFSVGNVLLSQPLPYTVLKLLQETACQYRDQCENIFEKKTVMWRRNHVHLGEHFFSPTTSLGFLGRSRVFRSKTFLKSSWKKGDSTSGKVFLVPYLGLRSQITRSCRTS